MAHTGNFHRIASRNDIDPDELLVCPYDPIHRVRSKKFPYHIMKCKKNFPTKRMDTCPFNARHIIEFHEMRHHLCICPDKTVLESDIIHQQGVGSSGRLFKGNTDVPPYHNPEWEMPEPEENWDLEENQSHMFGSNNVRPSASNVDWMTNAERKRYHEDLKQDAIRRAQGKPALESDEQIIEDKPEDKPLRLPRETPMVLQQQKHMENKIAGPKIAANIFGEADDEQQDAIVPTEDMFMKASINIASLFRLGGKQATSSVLGQVAKTAATHALLGEIQKKSLSAAPPMMSQVSELPGATTLALSPMHYVANTDNTTAPMNYAMATSNSSTDVAPRQSSAGVSPFVSAGLGRGRGRGIMDLLKRPGGIIANTHVGGKKLATSGAVQVQSYGVQQVQSNVMPVSLPETYSRNTSEPSVNPPLPSDPLSDIQLKEKKAAEKEATKKKKVPTATLR